MHNLIFVKIENKKRRLKVTNINKVNPKEKSRRFINNFLQFAQVFLHVNIYQYRKIKIF